MVYGLRTYEWICVMKYFDSQSLCGGLEWVLCVNYLGKQLLCIVLEKIFWRWCEYKFKYYAYWSCEFGRPVSIIYFAGR